MMSLDQMEQWSGGIDDLVERAALISRVLQIDPDGPEPNIRLIRDYTQRGIISRPDRDGKIAVYGFRHLVEYLAARVLASDGWPLQKIAEQFQTSDFAAIRSLIPGETRLERLESQTAPPPRNAALDAIDEIRKKQQEGQASPKAPRFARMKTPPAGQDFRDRTLQSTRMQSELPGLLQEIGSKEREPRWLEVTEIEIAPGVALEIETRRLRRIGKAEAEAIGRAVTAVLLNPKIRAGG